MADDSNFFEWAFKGLVGGAFMAVGYLWSSLAGDVKALGKSHTEFQLDAEKRFAKEDHVNENLNRVTTAVTALQNAINTNTNMTSIVMEKITSINERLKNQ